MTNLEIELKTPYLVFVGGEASATYAKTGAGLVEWCRDACLAQSRLGTDAVDLGLPDMSPKEAFEAGAKSLVIGVANVGGGIPDEWMPVLVEAAEAGLDIVAGMHTSLKDVPALVRATEASGAELVDVRVPPKNLPVGNGKKRSGRRVLTVGTDCALGKKYTALALADAMREGGFDADFRATGQTGIMIVGRGIPIDAVVSDFVSGAAETLSPDNDPNHWDVVEGQGSLFHPGYAGVSLGLLHGSQPDAFVVCHEAHRKTIQGWDHFEVPTIAECIDRVTLLGQLTNPNIRCVGISVNTSTLEEDKRRPYLADLGEKYGLPCVDPLVTGMGSIVERIKQDFPNED